MSEEESHTQIPSREPLAERIVKVLAACAQTRQAMTLAQLGADTGLPKSTLHRLCWQFVDLGLLIHTDSGFLIGPKLLELGNSNPIITQVRALSIPALVQLQRAAGASYLAVFFGDQVLVVDGSYTATTRASLLIGQELPLHSSAAGKALLAATTDEHRERLLGKSVLQPKTHRTIVQPGRLREHLQGVADSGVAISNEEHELGIVGAAAAFTSPDGMPFALGVLGSSSDPAVLKSTKLVADLAEQLQDICARRVSH